MVSPAARPYALVTPTGIHIENSPGYKEPILFISQNEKHYKFKDADNKVIKIWKNWSCDRCKTNITLDRRKGPNGPATLCNADGLQYRRDRERHIAVLNKYQPVAEEFQKIVIFPEAGLQTAKEKMSIHNLLN